MSAPPKASFAFDGVHRPPRVRLVNALGRLSGRVAQRATPLFYDSIVRAAERRAGLSADGDEELAEPLWRLLDSIEADARLSPFGRLAVRKQLVKVLSERLRVNDYLAHHPEVLDVPLERPVFILGSPRTGSTFLHNLMALDPANKVPRLWELMSPVPPGEMRNGGADPRFKEAREFVRELERLSPLSLKIHPMTAEGPEECRFLLERTFVGGQFMLYYRIDRYVEWFLGLGEERLRSAGLDVRRQMQLIGAGSPSQRWVGKSTVHAIFGRGLIRAFPDACVVQLLRDPVEIVPSICSLGASLRSIFSDAVDPLELGPEALDMFVANLERNRELSAMPPPATICQVRYDDLVADPVGVVERIYREVGLTLADELRDRLIRYVADHPRRGGGVHRYSPEQFGLSTEEIRRRVESHAVWLEGFGR